MKNRFETQIAEEIATKSAYIIGSVYCTECSATPVPCHECGWEDGNMVVLEQRDDGAWIVKYGPAGCDWEHTTEEVKDLLRACY